MFFGGLSSDRATLSLVLQRTWCRSAGMVSTTAPTASASESAMFVTGSKTVTMVVMNQIAVSEYCGFWEILQKNLNMNRQLSCPLSRMCENLTFKFFARFPKTSKCTFLKLVLGSRVRTNIQN